MRTHSVRGTALTSLFSLFMVTAAHADECMAAAESQLAINTCANEAFETANKEMNNQLHEALQRVENDTDRHKLLSEAAQAWLAFRDAECAFVASATAGGSMYSMVYDLCRNDLTEQRSALLQGYLHCEEWDTSCPLPPEN